MNIENVWTNSVIEDMEVSHNPIAIEYNLSNNNRYVSRELSITVSVIDTSSLTLPPPAEEPRTIANILNPDSKIH